jgi:hypothetical protein
MEKFLISFDTHYKSVYLQREREKKSASKSDQEERKREKLN